MLTHYANDSATAEWIKAMSDMEHERELDIEVLDTGTYPILVAGVVNHPAGVKSHARTLAGARLETSG